MKIGVFFIIEPPTIHSFVYLEDTELIALYNLGIQNENGDMGIFR